MSGEPAAHEFIPPVYYIPDDYFVPFLETMVVVESETNHSTTI